jgi:hypothetical protein
MIYSLVYHDNLFVGTKLNSLFSVMCGRTYARRRRARDVRREAERAARTQEGQASG